MEMKLDLFRKTYSPLEISWTKFDEAREHKPDKKAFIYYFNVDLKFILKARLFKLRQQFEEKVNLRRRVGVKYKCIVCE